MPIVTIKDVAKAASVSIATVSRVFNNAEVVEEATRVRVQEASQRLNYIPNAVGRSLSTRRTDAIGLLLPDLFGEFFSEVLRGSDQTAQQSDYHLVVSSSHNGRAEIRAALRMMRGRVDGLVIMSPHLDAETLNRNLPQSLPVVLLNCYVDTDRFDSLAVDNYGGAYAMTQHLLSHGHKHIAILKGTDRNFDAAERLRGFKMAVANHGSGGACYEINGNFSEASGYDSVKEILALTPRPTAVFASNDSMAIGALSALRDSGLQVPKDIALAGFDDIPIASYMTPSLTTVHVGIHGLGVHAIETVLHAFKNKNEHHKQQVLLSTTLSLRGSCGCDQSNNVNQRSA